MCGIIGILSFNKKSVDRLKLIDDATDCLNKRGPDSKGIYKDGSVALGHRRLSIIDTSSAGNQPMTDPSGRFVIVFNGEFFNYADHIQYVRDHGFSLRSHSDTEIVLYLYMIDGEKCLQKINGFFSFAIYDKEKQTVFIARDRMGIKPLVYHSDENSFSFASELKALVKTGVPAKMDNTSLYTYLQLNYIPGTDTIYQNVKKLPPGNYLKVDLSSGKIKTDIYYALYKGEQNEEYANEIRALSYETQQKKLRELLFASVEKRMIADVPLGSFLSGGVDSSIVSAIAATFTPHLKTFSIGFADEPLYDETKFAKLVATKINSDHTVFKLKNDDLFQNLFNTLDYLDEPFADSSALNVFILSKETRKHVTVALSGDGADELFGGYNKHEAELRARSGGAKLHLLKLLRPLLLHLPQSRNSKIGNLFRKAYRMAEGLNLSPANRYWRWAGYTDEASAQKLFQTGNVAEFYARKNELLSAIQKQATDISDVLYTDLKMVLPGDMLTKVDMMSMANSLEVRVPFLDYTVVDFVTRLPIHTKIDSTGRKLILKDAFRNELPEEIFTRGKKGFEVPLLKWFRNELSGLINDDLLSEKFISEQHLFNYDEISLLKKKLHSANPGDSTARIWGLIVFQYWYKRNMS